MAGITINISPKYQYEPLYTEKSRYKDLWGGRGRGGSHEGTLYALQKLTSPVYYRIAFIRKIYKDVRHSLWRDFKDRKDECGLPDIHFDMADHEMRCVYLPTGNSINSFGVKAEGGRTAKLKSLAGYNLIVMEECDELTQEEFDMIDDSLRTIKGPAPEIVRIFNPPGRLHWIWRDYNLLESTVPGYWKAEPKTNVNLVSIFSTYKDNIINLAQTTLEKWPKYEITNPDYYFTIIQGLISEGQRGRIYSGWQPITQQAWQDIEAQSVCGLDFGTSSPAGMVEVKMVKNRCYIRELNYDPLTNKEIAIKLCKLGFTGKNVIIADSAEATSINKLRNGWAANELSELELQLYPQMKKGFYCIGAVKGPGSIDFGIKAVKDMEVFVTDDSVNIWNEYRDYKWAMDKDKNPTDIPEDNNNHLMDSIRYAVTAKGRFY